MLSEHRRQLSQIAVLVIVVIILIIVGNYIYEYLTTGVITVSSSNSTNVVKIEQIASSNTKNPISKLANGKLTIRLKPGKYEIFAYSHNDLYGASKLVTLKSRQNLKFTLNPPTTSFPEPVYGGSVDGLYADNNHLFFVPLSPSPIKSTVNTGYLLQSSQGTVSQPFSNVAFTNIKWINSNTGIGEDVYNNLYLINGGGLSQINLPFNASSSQLSADMESSGTIYVSDGQNIYKGGLSGNFSKIYSSSGGVISQLASNGSGVAAIIHGGESDVPGSNQSSGGDALVYVTKAGKVISKQAQNMTNATWTNDGKYLLTESGTTAYIYDSSLRLSKTITINGAGNYTWLDDNTVIYSVGEKIWAFKLNSGQSTIITSLALKQNIENIYLSNDGAYLYFTENNSQGTQLFRVGLKGQPTNQSLSSLSVFLPTTVSLCSMNYINFNEPTILLTYPLAVSLQTCTSVAQTELQTFNINPSTFQYVSIP